MSFNIHSPKLDRELLKAIGRKQIKMTKTAINLIIRLTPYVDNDGRIQLDKNEIKRKSYYESRSFYNGLDELCKITYKEKELLTKENGYYVSNFHVSSNGKENQDTYLKNFPTFHQPEFLGLTLNQVRLFLYVATLNIHNQFTRVAVENLYKNKLQDPDLGMDVYDSYQDMRNDLLFLIKNSYISVRLDNELVLDASTPECKEKLDKAFGFEGGRKGRTSPRLKLKHYIGLKVTQNIYNAKATRNKASETEIRLLAERYHMFHEDIQQKTYYMFIEKKNNLMEQFGEAGLEIYRASLEKYFEEKHENITYYDLKDKAVNYFTDFYLLEEVKKVLVAALKFEVTKSRGDVFTSAYQFKEIHIPELVNYFIADSSEEHKVLIDQEIKSIDNANELMFGLSAEEHWTDLSDSIRVVYRQHISNIRSELAAECIKNGITDPTPIFDKIDEKELIVSLAKESLLSRKKTMDEDAKKLKQIVRFFRKTRIPIMFKPAPETILELDKKPIIKPDVSYITG